MARKTNPRRELVKQLRLAKSLLELHIGAWTAEGSMTVYDVSSRDGKANVEQRKRREDEYPENQPERWRAVAETLRSLAQWAESTARQCERNAETIEARRQVAARQQARAARQAAETNSAVDGVRWLTGR